MTTVHHFVPVVLAITLLCPVVAAKPNGFAVPCGGCHYGELGDGNRAPAPKLTAVAASRVEPGEQVVISVSVESLWSDAVAAGFLVISGSKAGVFTPSDEGTANVGIEDGATFDYAIGHAVARDLSTGTATFSTTWTAPMNPGTYGFAVYGVTSDDGDGMDDPNISEETNDPYATIELQVGVGCDLVPYYYDADLDGYGSEEAFFCEQPSDYATVGGDCQDDDANVNPGAVEQCSFIDENCDGEAMAPPTFYRDTDGDGYGEASALVVDTCAQPEGYAAQAGDCAPFDPAVHPGATELATNAIDDNCNGQTDEAAAAVVPAPSAESSTHSTSGPAPSTNEVMTSQVDSLIANDTTGDVSMSNTVTPTGRQSGCSVALNSRANAYTLTLLLVGVGLVRRRCSRCLTTVST